MISSNILHLWIIPNNGKFMATTNLEKNISKSLSKKRAEEFLYSRGQIREVLSRHFDIPALEVQLEAMPGKPPILQKNLGNLSFSHCKDALFLGLSNIKFGIDIERKDRRFNYKSIVDKFFLEEEKKDLKFLYGEELRIMALKMWVIKESSIKWQKGSISRDLSKWSIRKDLKRAYHLEKNIFLSTCYLDYLHWSIGIAHNAKFLKINPISIFS